MTITLEELLSKKLVSLESLLKDGDTVTTVNKQGFIFFNNSFIGTDSIFYLHNLDKSLASPTSGHHSYSIATIHRGTAVPLNNLYTAKPLLKLRNYS